MKLKKFGFGQAKRLKIHYERSKEDDGLLKDTSYSKIDPTKSHLNYNLCEGDLVELLEAEGLRDKFVLVCGGPRISHELAKELGYDAGFGPGKFAEDVATFAVTEMVSRELA